MITLKENENSILRKILNENISEQDAIELDNKNLVYALRNKVTEADCSNLVNKCYDNTISSKVKCLYITLIRKYCTSEPFKQQLKILWEKADDILKEAILWRLLDDETLDEDWHQKIFDYVKINYSTYFKESIITYYGVGEKGLKEAIQSLNDNQFPETKKWIYLFGLIVYKDIDNEMVKSALSHQKTISKYSFTSKVCDYILTNFSL